MASGRRLAVLVVVLALVGAPAVALRAFCVGQSCTQDEAVAAPVPFCPLPKDLRAEIEAGYRQGRSPDVMGATASSPVIGGSDATIPLTGWPAAPYSADANRVPIAFLGAGVRAGTLSRGAGVDQIAPTIARLIGYDRPYADVRSGTALAGAASGGVAPRLIVEIVWSGVGSDAFTQTGAPWVQRHIAASADAASTFWGTTGSLPADPAAVLTTIGTGGLPFQHGITGTVVRGADGSATRAWSRGAPISIIGTLADDWDHASGQRARIGLVAPDMIDRGMIGGTWYLDHDRDDLVIGSSDPAAAVARLVADGFGADTIPDILAVVLDGSSQEMDRGTGKIVTAVQGSVPDSTFVLTATGPTYTSTSEGIAASAVMRQVNSALGVDVISTATPGGFFLNTDVMAANDLTSDDVVRQMDALKGDGDSPVFADAYPGFAVAFSRYC